MFGARTLVIITGGFEALKSAGHDGDIDYARSLLVERLALAAELADSYRVRLALSPAPNGLWLSVNCLNSSRITRYS